MSSNNFFANTIVNTQIKINDSTHPVAPGQENLVKEDHNSMSNKQVETQALMDNRQYHQEHKGRLRTPDANTYASILSSNSINLINNQEQHVTTSTSNTSQMVSNVSVQDIFSQLHEALALEPKYQPQLFLPPQSNVSEFFK